MSKSKCTCAFPCGGTGVNCPSNFLYASEPKDGLAYYDKKIQDLEDSLSNVQADRREYINRNNLNKE